MVSRRHVQELLGNWTKWSFSVHTEYGIDSLNTKDEEILLWKSLPLHTSDSFVLDLLFIGRTILCVGAEFKELDATILF